VKRAKTFKPKRAWLAKATACKHCSRPARYPTRGLCQPCYKDKAVRERYPRLRETQTRAAPAARVPPLAPEPTPAPPGSREKVAVMEWRVHNGYQPFHPGDARGPGVSWAGFNHLLPGNYDPRPTGGKPRTGKCLHARRGFGRSGKLLNLPRAANVARLIGLDD
jgi:hypothetical protein